MSAPLFERATASKALFMTSLICTSASAYFDSRLDGLGAKPTLRTLLLSQLSFKKYIPEMLIGLGLLYVFRHIEREIGTRRFVSFCFVSTTLSITLQIVVLTLTNLIAEGKTLTPGPYGPIFSLMVLYYAYVPAIGTPMFGIRLNHKIPVYGMGLILATLDGRSSLVPVCCALFAGALAFTQIKRFVMPESIARFGVRYIEPFFKSESRFARDDPGPFRQPGLGRGPMMGRAAGQQDDVLLPNFFGPPPNAAVNAIPAPSEEDILTLVNMGFDAGEAATALRNNRNDVNRAAEALLMNN